MTPAPPVHKCSMCSDSTSATASKDALLVLRTHTRYTRYHHTSPATPQPRLSVAAADPLRARQTCFEHPCLQVQGGATNSTSRSRIVFFLGAAPPIQGSPTRHVHCPSLESRLKQTPTQLVELMLMLNFFTFVGSRKSCAPTPIASLDCRPRLPIAAFDTVSAASASTNSS